MRNPSSAFSSLAATSKRKASIDPSHRPASSRRSSRTDPMSSRAISSSTHAESQNKVPPISKPSKTSTKDNFSRVAKAFEKLFVGARERCSKIKKKFGNHRHSSRDIASAVTPSRSPTVGEEHSKSHTPSQPCSPTQDTHESSPVPRNRVPSLQDDDYVRTIEVAFKDKSGSETLHFAKAVFDTGNPKNLISPAFVAKFRNVFEPKAGEAILDTAGSGKYISVGTVRGRWACAPRRGRLQFAPKFMDAEFEVSQHNEFFDVVIGADTIREEKLLMWSPDLCLTGFRTRPPTASEVAERERMQKLAIEQNEARKRELLQQAKNASNGAATNGSTSSERPK